MSSPGEPGVVSQVRVGAPFQDAAYRTDAERGSKSAFQTVPSRNVSRRNSANGAGARRGATSQARVAPARRRRAAKPARRSVEPANAIRGDDPDARTTSPECSLRVRRSRARSDVAPYRSRGDFAR